MLKKFVCFLLVLSMMLTFISCGGTGDNGGGDTDSGNGGSDNGGENGGNGGNDGNEENNGTVISGGKFNIADKSVTVIYNSDNEEEEELARAFADKLREKTGVRLNVSSSSYKDSEYELTVGYIQDRVLSASEFEKLNGYITVDTAAYSIAVKDKTVAVTSTGIEALQEALGKLEALISGDKLELSVTHSEEYIIYKEGEKTVSVKPDVLTSSVLLTSISIDGKPLGWLNSVDTEYTVFYNENLPQNIEVRALSNQATVTQRPMAGGGVKLKVVSADGSAEKTYVLSFEFMDLRDFSANVIGKDGTVGTVSFVFDDGNQQTADILNTVLLPKYDKVTVTHGIIADRLASYSGDPKGSYTLEKKDNTYVSIIDGSPFKKKVSTVVDFWKEILKNERVEALSHSNSHTAEGIQAKYDIELMGSQQILRDLLGVDAQAYIKPGVGSATNFAPYIEMLKTNGTYIGARTNSTMNNGYKVNFVSDFKTPANRFNTQSLTAYYHGTSVNPVTFTPTTTKESSKEDCLAAGIPHWTGYIDAAIEQGGWAPYCLHGIITDEKDHTNGRISEYWSYQTQIDSLFAYAQQKAETGKLWIAKYGDAQKYYNSWSTASVIITSSIDGSVSVSVTDNEPDSAIDVALTVKVLIPDTWTSVSFIYNGESGTLEVKTGDNGERFVYANIVPDKGEFLITNK